MIAQLVYILCALTSITCAALLLRGYRKTRAHLLLASGACFVLLAIANILLFVDLVLTASTTDLSLLRNSVTAAAHLVLVLGLIIKS